MSNWTDFNNAENQNDLIPAGSLVKLHLTIRPGGYDDANQGWTGGYASQSKTSPAIYLDCECTVLEGRYAKRKVWTRIGLYSPNGDTYANMGRRLIKGILNSARGLSEKDNSPEAQARRRIQGFAELDGMTFIAKLGLNKEGDQNEIKAAITADHKDYATLMQGVASSAEGAGQWGNNDSGSSAPSAPVAPAPAPASPPTSNRPSWAQ